MYVAGRTSGSLVEVSMCPSMMGLGHGSVDGWVTVEDERASYRIGREKKRLKRGTRLRQIICEMVVDRRKPISAGLLGMTGMTGKETQEGSCFRASCFVLRASGLVALSLCDCCIGQQARGRGSFFTRSVSPEKWRLNSPDFLRFHPERKSFTLRFPIVILFYLLPLESITNALDTVVVQSLRIWINFQAHSVLCGRSHG